MDDECHGRAVDEQLLEVAQVALALRLAVAQDDDLQPRAQPLELRLPHRSLGRVGADDQDALTVELVDERRGTDGLAEAALPADVRRAVGFEHGGVVAQVDLLVVVQVVALGAQLSPDSLGADGDVVLRRVIERTDLLGEAGSDVEQLRVLRG